MTTELTSTRLDAGPSPAPPAQSAAMPKHVAKDLVHGTSALGLGLILERGCGFLANLLAARLGGASTFRRLFARSVDR